MGLYSYLRHIGTNGSGDGQFDGVTGVAEYSDELYVSETLNDRVQVVDSDGNYIRKWGTPGVGNGEFNNIIDAMDRIVALHGPNAVVSDYKFFLSVNGLQSTVEDKK